MLQRACKTSQQAAFLSKASSIPSSRRPNSCWHLSTGPLAQSEVDLSARNHSAISTTKQMSKFQISYLWRPLALVRVPATSSRARPSSWILPRVPKYQRYPSESHLGIRVMELWFIQPVSSETRIKSLSQNKKGLRRHQLRHSRKEKWKKPRTSKLTRRISRWTRARKSSKGLHQLFLRPRSRRGRP